MKEIMSDCLHFKKIASHSLLARPSLIKQKIATDREVTESTYLRLKSGWIDSIGCFMFLTSLVDYIIIKKKIMAAAQAQERKKFTC